ncbi:unnamed protein product [Sphenostylis stenocarpa]|uniref:Uncharacterized protein n=1 Tax=Sphenostylis stenocarpa TaxID=92480 RepID=A0AA86VAP7_9FABA|nr:unnamed protein product [Sphenostylis stenocarpa]
MGPNKGLIRFPFVPSNVTDASSYLFVAKSKFSFLQRKVVQMMAIQNCDTAHCKSCATLLCTIPIIQNLLYKESAAVAAWKQLNVVYSMAHLQHSFNRGCLVRRNQNVVSADKCVVLLEIQSGTRDSELEALQREHEEKNLKIEELKRQIEMAKRRLEKKKEVKEEQMGGFNNLSKKYNSLREEYNAMLAEKLRKSK